MTLSCSTYKVTRIYSLIKRIKKSDHQGRHEDETTNEQAVLCIALHLAVY